MKNLNTTAILLLCVLFVNSLSAQTVIKKQKPDKKYHDKSIKTTNPKNNNLIKVQAESISNDSKGEIKQDKIISNKKIRSSKVKMISPTTVTPNTTKRKKIKPSNSKYQRKKIKTKEVKDE